MILSFIHIDTMPNIQLDKTTLEYVIKILLRNRPPKKHVDERIYHNGYVQAIEEIEKLLEEQ